jgi:hypothetical protein
VQPPASFRRYFFFAFFLVAFFLRLAATLDLAFAFLAMMILPV